MPSFSDSIFLFLLALLLFGPKRLPVLARELGKWVGEFRRASNEFKMQMEEELRASEQAEREQKIAAIEAAAPAAPAIASPSSTPQMLETSSLSEPEFGATAPSESIAVDPVETSSPLPIAESGELKIMPPPTGLPAGRSARASADPLGGLLERIPAVDDAAGPTETANHD